MNHARDNFYQPGALIYADSKDIDAGTTNPTYTTTGTWTAITHEGITLEISYTPPVDCMALVFLKITTQHTNADENYIFRVNETTGPVVLFAFYVDGMPAYNYSSWYGQKYRTLIADTAYKFQAQFYISNATLKILRESEHTFLQLLVFRKP